MLMAWVSDPVCSKFREGDASAGHESGLESPEFVDLPLVPVHLAIYHVGDAHGLAPSRRTRRWQSIWPWPGVRSTRRFPAVARP